jgi:membrane glycosyltransferase
MNEAVGVDGRAQQALDAYLEALALPPEAAEALRAELTPLAARGERTALFEALHRALAQAPVTAADAPLPVLASLRRRLTLLLGADPHPALGSDGQGHPRLISVPPMQRAHMKPRPWDLHLLQRAGRWLRRSLLGARAHLDVPPATPPPRRTPWRVAARWRRLLLVVLTLSQAWVATSFMTAVLPYHGSHPLEIAILALYAILFTWVGLGFWTALMGFWMLLRGPDRHTISSAAATDVPISAGTRTALLIPICNEDVGRVFAGIRATYDSLRRAGARELFDFYILSDSNDPDARVGELAAWLRLCQSVDGFGHIYYRRRRLRLKRKSGNVADWCRRWGSLYKYMVVFDADSVMSGDCLKRLVQLMEARPDAGIIQTAPRAAGRETLYARIQQFATRVYGPLFTAGLHFWQLGESHYWGHNAILRVAPFMQHCALGRLPGRGPLGGEILSHDFVEAALMRRAGWSVWIAYDLPGSYEEMPPTLLDELKRDQRWCQGNLQNFRLFFSSGLHPAHRAVFMTGVMAYLSAPLWFAFLALSTALLAVHTLGEPQYFSEPYQLFPTWPEWRPEWALRLFAATATLLLLPKLLAVVRLLLRPRERPLYGGSGALLLSLLLEGLFAALLAPVRMLFHTRYVLGALLGFGVQWKSPPRADVATPWGEALRRHGSGTVLGLAWLGGVWWLKPEYIDWLLPVAGALVIAVPVSVWSSRTGPGRWCQRRRLFLIPEETRPPAVLRWLWAALRRPLPPHDLDSAVRDPRYNALLAAAAPMRPAPVGGGLLDDRARLTLAHQDAWLKDLAGA